MDRGRKIDFLVNVLGAPTLGHGSVGRWDGKSSVSSHEQSPPYSLQHPMLTFSSKVKLPPSNEVDALLEASTVVALPDELLQHILKQEWNVLDPRAAVAFSSASHGLWAATQALLQHLKADHEGAAALCRKLGMRSCKELREAKEVECHCEGLTAADLGLLGTLGSVLPVLKELYLYEPAAGPDAVQLLAEGLGADALPAVTRLCILDMQVGDAGVLALAAALAQGALPRLERLDLNHTAIGDEQLVALAPALRQLPALEDLDLESNPFGDEGLAALVAQPPPAGAMPPPAGGPPPPTGALANLRRLDLDCTQITDAGCAALAAALERGALPVLKILDCEDILASNAGLVYDALHKRAHDESDSESEPE